MPECVRCDRYFAPTALTPDGACPACGEPVAWSETSTPKPATRSGIPWHFWLILVLASVYLGWRAIQLVVWLISRVA